MTFENLEEWKCGPVNALVLETTYSDVDVVLLEINSLLKQTNNATVSILYMSA